MNSEEQKYPVVDESMRAKRNSNLCTKAKKRDKYICQVCGFKGNEAHHIHPIQLGGNDELSNLVCLCRDCHKLAPHDQDKFLSFQRTGGRRKMTIYGVAAIEARKNPHITFAQAMEVADNVHRYMAEMSFIEEND